MNYFIKRGETEAGPYSHEQIQAWINEGLLTQNDFGRPEHSQEWLPLQAVIPSISPSSSPKTINAPAQAPQQNSLGMIAAIVGMFALLMGGGIAGVVYYTKKEKGPDLEANSPRAFNKENDNGNPKPSPTQASAQETPPNSNTTDLVSFPLLPERERLPVSLTRFLPGKKLHYILPDSEEPTWTEFLTDGSANTADFNGQAQYTIEEKSVTITLQINETLTSQYKFTFPKIPVDTGDTLEVGSDQGLAKVTKVESNLSGSSLLPPPQTVEIKPPFDPEQLLMRADSGEAAAQALLARCHHIGWYFKKDESEALKWAQKAADQDHLAGKYTLAMLQLTAQKIVRDEPAGLALLESIMPQIRAEADKGNPWFQSKLAVCYQSGYGVPQKDPEKFRELIQKCAHTDPFAQNALAHARREGKIGEKNMIDFIKWHRKAAEQGFNRSFGDLGVAYMTNNGLKEDKEEGARMFHHLAQRNGPYGAYCLSLALKKGNGIESPNLPLSEEWNRKAAELGRTVAISILVSELTKGIPTTPTGPSNTTTPQPAPQNVVEAYMWSYIGFNIDKNVGSRRSYFQSQMSRLAKLLLADQVTEAISHAKEKFPNLDLRYALSSSSYSMKADALYEITSRNKATFEEMRRISNLQTNLNPRIQAMAVLALEQLAPTNINRKLGVVMDERYRTHRVKEQPNPNIKDLNLLSRRYSETFLLSYLGDSISLSRLQDEILESTNSANSIASEQLAKVLVLLPANEKHIATANEIIDRSIQTGQNSRNLYWSVMTKALIQYRAKEFQEVEQWADSVLNAPDDVRKHWGNVAPCWFLKAAALQRSNKPEEARKAFANGKLTLEAAWEMGRVAIYGYAHDYLLCKQLEREIGALIPPNP